MSPARRRQIVDREHSSLSLVRQCTLLGVSRSSIYYRPRAASAEDLSLIGEIDRQYLETLFYGSRRMKAWLERRGMPVSRKRVQRLMRAMGLDPGDVERLSVAGPRRPGVLPVPERPAGTAAGGQAGGVHRVHRPGRVPPPVSRTAFMSAPMLHQGLRAGSFPAGLASRKYEVKRRCRAVLNQGPSYS